MLSIAIMLSASPLTPDTAPRIERGTIALTAANTLAAAAIASCRSIGREAVVAVVDRGGNLIVLQRGDDVGPHNTEAAQRKAFTALSKKTGTTVLAERAASDPASQNLVSIPELLLLGGGLPLNIDGETIGAVGVAGAGGAANDDHCARAAIEHLVHEQDSASPAAENSDQR